MGAKLAICLALLASGARAEFLRIEVFMRDMNCESCSETLASSFKRMRGVANAQVDFKAGTVRVDLAEKSRIGLDQVWDTIKRVGFTPGETKVTVRGALKGSKLEVPEVGKTYDVEFAAAHAPDAESIQLSGVIAPPPNPRTPIVIRQANPER